MNPDAQGESSVIPDAAPDNEREDDRDVEEDDDVTLIVLDQRPGDANDQYGLGWIDQDSPEMEERRRNVLLRELQRVQRMS